MLSSVWQVRSSVFTDSIKSHLASGCCLFQKSVVDPPAGFHIFDANIGLYPDTNDEDDDVYVELRLSKDRIYAYSCNCHPHVGLRLPKVL